MNLEESSDEELWAEAIGEDPWLRADVLMQLGHRKIQQEDWSMAKGLFGSAAEWGENNLELKRLEEVKNLMLDTMSLMLNIEVKR